MIEDNFFIMFFNFVFIYNLIILFFNLLPIFPLDGGQLLISLVWLITGNKRSAFKFVLAMGLPLGLILAALAATYSMFFISFIFLFCAVVSFITYIDPDSLIDEKQVSLSNEDIINE